MRPSGVHCSFTGGSPEDEPPPGPSVGSSAGRFRNFCCWNKSGKIRLENILFMLGVTGKYD